MKSLFASSIRDLLPAWFMCVVAAAPAMLVAKSGAAGLMYFFVACASFVAYAFRHEANPKSQSSDTSWRLTLSTTSLGLLGAWLIFAVYCSLLHSPQNYVSGILGLMLLVPCICVVPYMVQVTRQPFAAVVFSLTLVVLVKLLGCTLAVCVYGWDADAQGQTSMPWANPNLLVWSIWIGTAALSAVTLYLSNRRWRSARAVEVF